MLQADKDFLLSTVEEAIFQSRFFSTVIEKNYDIIHSSILDSYIKILTIREKNINLEINNARVLLLNSEKEIDRLKTSLKSLQKLLQKPIDLLKNIKISIPV